MDDLNVAADVAVCRHCEEAFALSGLVDAVAEPDAVDVRQPPVGAWFRELKNGFEVGATTRSWQAFLLVPFTAVWSGGSMAGIYGTQIAKGQFNLVFSLFGLPFLAGTIFLVSTCLLMICGRVVVSVQDNRGEVFVGVGPLGRRRRFAWDEVRTISEEYSRYRSGSWQQGIALAGKGRILFGTPLSDARRYFIMHALKAMKASR
jgi:hypothetical protein